MLCLMYVYIIRMNIYEYLWLYNFITTTDECGILCPTSFHASHEKNGHGCFHRVTMHLQPGSALTSSVPSADRKWKLGELGLGTASHGLK